MKEPLPRNTIGRFVDLEDTGFWISSITACTVGAKDTHDVQRENSEKTA